MFVPLKVNDERCLQNPKAVERRKKCKAHKERQDGRKNTIQFGSNSVCLKMEEDVVWIEIPMQQHLPMKHRDTFGYIRHQIQNCFKVDVLPIAS